MPAGNRKPSICREYFKRVSRWFWGAWGIESVAADIETHGSAVKKARVLWVITVFCAVSGSVGFWLNGCRLNPKIDDLLKQAGTNAATQNILRANSASQSTLLDEKNVEILKLTIELAPIKAMASSLFTNEPPYKQLDLLVQTIRAISNAVNFSVPSLPVITIETLAGLPIEETNNPNLRLHRLLVRNTNDVEISNFRSRLQIPEPIVSTRDKNQSVGTLLGWRRLRIELLTEGSPGQLTGGRSSGGLWVGGASALHFLYPEEAFNVYGYGHRGEKMEFVGAGDTGGVWELVFDKLPPGGYASILFVTSNAERGTNYIRFATEPLWNSPPNPLTVPDTNELAFSLEGEFEFRAVNKPGRQHFIVPIEYDVKFRKLLSLPIESNVGRWHPIILNPY